MLQISNFLAVTSSIFAVALIILIDLDDQSGLLKVLPRFRGRQSQVLLDIYVRLTSGFNDFIFIPQLQENYGLLGLHRNHSFKPNHDCEDYVVSNYV